MSPDESLELFPSSGRTGASRARKVDAGPSAPLPDRMRPRTIDDVVGQSHLLGEGCALRALFEAAELPSLILWGPPGSGKTTLARLLAATPNTWFAPLSAVLAGVKEIRAVVERARHEAREGVRTLLFLDEIHRLNRAQQDVLLPHVEAGTVTLIGATTENPSFEVNAPLLSRCRVFTLKALDEEDLARLVERAISDRENGLGALGVALDPEALHAIAHAADGDARRALGLLEAAVSIHRRGPHAHAPLPPEAVREAAGQRVLLHDRDREEHYNVVSAFIKSLRASDPDASLYYLARMLEAGEDPLYPARRLVIFASEDIGSADPTALMVATSAHLAIERIGMPEAKLVLAQATTHLACAPKSNAALTGIARAQEAVMERGSLPVPMHLRNAPTPLMKGLGYGRDYNYPHEEPDHFVPDPNLPEAIADARFYEPSDQGAERQVRERLEAWREKRDRARGSREEK